MANSRLLLLLSKSAGAKLTKVFFGLILIPHCTKAAVILSLDSSMTRLAKPIKIKEGLPKVVCTSTSILIVSKPLLMALKVCPNINCLAKYP
jgi:hypothetical protein